MAQPRHLLLSHSSYLPQPLKSPEFESHGLAGLKAAMKPRSRFLWPWGHGTGQGETAVLAQEAKYRQPAAQRKTAQPWPSFPIQTLLLSPGPLPQPPHPLPAQDPPVPIPACVSGISLKRPGFDHAILLLDLTTNLPPSPCLAFDAPMIQPHLPSQTHHPDLHPHAPLPGCPPPLTSTSLRFA